MSIIIHYKNQQTLAFQYLIKIFSKQKPLDGNFIITLSHLSGKFIVVREWFSKNKDKNGDWAHETESIIMTQEELKDFFKDKQANKLIDEWIDSIYVIPY